LKVGNGLDPNNDMGSLANQRRVDAMDAFVADAVGKGARLVTGGARIGNQGYFYPMTVLADVPDNARAAIEEPFGPLALISSVQSLDEAIQKANSLPYGLAAYAFTNVASNIEALTDRIECGNLAINHFTASYAETPFGGVKDSGYGHEGGTEGLQCYTIAKLVSHKAAA
jgi:succinate-semialdehyde dehydrogenase / glutarate-semialdehyde dehydrogenase